MSNLFWTIAAKRVEKRCCARTLQKVVAKSRTTLFILKQLFATCNNLICYKTGLTRLW